MITASKPSTTASEGPTEPSRATAPNKPLLRAQQPFSCSLFKRITRQHAAQSALSKLSDVQMRVHVCVCVCTRESACVSRVLACLHVHMCLYMFCRTSPSCTHTSFSMRGLIFNRNERLWMLIGLNTGKKKHFMCRRLHKGNVQPAQSRMEDIVLNHI